MRHWLAALALVGACGGDGDGAAPDAADPDAEVCTVPSGTEAHFDLAEPLCNKLSSYRFFKGDGSSQEPNDGVVPYALNTELFSDYTTKGRFVWLPSGTSIAYDADASFSFPVGAVILKTFAYLDDLRQPTGPRTLLETRLMVNRSDGWEGVSYVWDADQGEARIEVAGATVAASWIHSDGSTKQLDHAVPNKNQCKHCHAEHDDIMGPLGPKARHLNRDFDHGSGPVNQLTHLTTIGYLTGAPADPSTAPRAPVYDDVQTGTVEERARGWLDINCSHCHNPTGPARTSGLDLSITQTDPVQFGVCKTPVAAGQGSGGRQYNIVPGQPDASILTFRIESTEPDVRMPELGRQLVHEGGVALIREWITGMSGDPCTSN